MKSNVPKIIPMTMIIGDKTYTLDYDRESIAYGEDVFGLRFKDVADLMNAPATTIPNLFFLAFRKNHPEVTRDESDRIYTNILKGLKREEMKRLCELYTAHINDLFFDEESSERKNVTISL